MVRYALPLVLAVALAVLLAHQGPSHAQGPGTREGVVRLYSDGKVVGEWEAVDVGRVEGGTFVFPVRKGVQEVEVRIRGTFSFEESR